MRIVWSPTARSRAIQAMEFIEQERPLAALEWLEGLAHRVSLLAELPLQGRELTEWEDSSVRGGGASIRAAWKCSSHPNPHPATRSTPG